MAIASSEVGMPVTVTFDGTAFPAPVAMITNAQVGMEVANLDPQTVAEPLVFSGSIGVPVTTTFDGTAYPAPVAVITNAQVGMEVTSLP